MAHRTDPEVFRVAVDARPLAEPPGGLRRVLEGLLPAILETDPAIELELICTRVPDDRWRGRDRVGVSVSAWPMTALLRPLWERRQLPRSLAAAKADVFFSALGAVPDTAAAPVVVACQDLTFLTRPELLPWRHRVYWRHLARGWSRAQAVIAPSEATRRDLTERLGLDRDLVHVVPHAADDRFRPIDAATEDALRRSTGLRGPFVLWVGVDGPRKNLGVLLRAMEQVNAGRDPAVGLVMVGRRGPGGSTAPLPTWTRPLGTVDETTLTGLYGICTALAFPSLDEGFGLPAVEAMACGSPVLVADAGSLPEVVGDAGVVIPPTDVGGWARAIARVVDDPKLRSRLEERSLRRARRYSWAASAARVLGILRRVAASAAEPERRTGPPRQPRPQP